MDERERRFWFEQALRTEARRQSLHMEAACVPHADQETRAQIIGQWREETMTTEEREQMYRDNREALAGMFGRKRK